MDHIKNRLDFRKPILRALVILNGLLSLLYLFGATNVCRILTGKGKLSQCQWIGTVRRCLTGRDQLIGRCNRIMDLGNNL